MSEPTAAAPAPTTARQVRYYWEDFPVGSTREFGAMPVTRDATLAFAREFDPQPFHLDDEAAGAPVRQALGQRLAYLRDGDAPDV